MKQRDNNGDHKREALRTYIDLAKQQITIASALIVFTATLLGIFWGTNGATTPRNLFLTFMSWAFLIASIISGLSFHGRSVVLIDKGEYNANDRLLDRLGMVQQSLFVAGIICLGIFAGTNLGSG